MSTYGTRTIIHFTPSGRIDYRETTDFRYYGGKYVWGEMNDEEKAILNRPDGYTEMWNHLECDDIDKFDIDIYKNGNQIDSFYTNSEIFVNEERPKYIEEYCVKELAEELKQKPVDVSGIEPTDSQGTTYDCEFIYNNKTYNCELYADGNGSYEEQFAKAIVNDAVANNYYVN